MTRAALAETSPKRPGRGWLRSLRRALGWSALAVVTLTAIAAGWAWWSLRGSLPKLEDTRDIAGLVAEVRIERDALGIPTIHGANRRDLALATGFVHGQDRFFQMDLLRRRATGELGGLLGRRARNADARVRVHRLRQVARQALAAEPPARQALVEAYALGVNAGLDSLARPPFEYLVLRAEPESWQPEDSYAVLLAMFLQVQDENGDYESTLSLLNESLPPALFDFLVPRGTEWDTAIDGTVLGGGPLPAPNDVLLVASTPTDDDGMPTDESSTADTGSNAWAVAGSRTADARAILANDMHLGLSLPNIWYRASLVWPEEDGTAQHGTAQHGTVQRVTGITLPGAPVIVSGSNGRVAWGFTNSQIDTSDVVVWSPEEADDNTYLTPEGREPYQRHQEILRFKDGSEETLEVIWTRWGPLLEKDHRGRRKAVRWVGHEPAAVNFHLLELESASNVDQAVDIANRSGMPAQNLLTVDADGRIAWTIAGILPRRVGFDGRLPGSWADGSRSWSGWLAPEDVPRVVDPESGLLWSANQRMVGGEMLAKLGDGSYVLAARARQIRDRLEALDQPRELDMLTLQLDDQALFLARWRELLLEVLTPAATQADPRRAEARDLVEDWQGRAAPDAVGYRIVRRYRIALAQQVFGHLTRACKEIDPDFVYRLAVHLYEGPLWQMARQHPPHLLAPEHVSWQAQHLAAVDAALDFLLADGAPLDEQSWGERNTLAIRHPLGGLPLIGRFLSMPSQQVPGDNYMPRVQHPSAGASERMIVAPGHEAEGTFQMPGGQSGHPLSKHFDDQHASWVEGRPAAFLPGAPLATTTLRPLS